MADTKTVGEDDSTRMKRSKAKHVPILLDLWSSSDDDETSDVFSLASSSARFSEAKSSDNQMRSEPSLDTGVMVHQQPNRGREKIAPSTTQHVRPRISSSKVHSRPKALTLKKRKLPEMIDSRFTSSPPAGRKSSPVFPCSRKTVSLTYPHRTRLKTPTESSEDSTEEDSDVNSGGTTMKHNSCMYLRGNTGRQSSLKQSNDKFGRLPSSSSSESSSSDAESGATGVKNGNSCSRATIGRQPRREQTSSKYNSKLMFGSDSSTSSSSSSDSESLLLPTKSKRTQVQRISGATVLCSSLLQRVSSRLQPSQDVRKPGRCKRGLSKKGNQVPRFKRARVSQTFGIAPSESSSSSSSDTESEASLNSYLLDLKTRKRTAETIQRSRGGNKALGNGQQNPSPEKVTRRKMITLFGRTSSEEGRDTAEEDAKELGDEQEDNITETRTNKASVSSTNPQTSMVNLTGLSKGDNRGAGGICSEATTRKKIYSFSERDDSVILVDITQSTERGALARQSRPQAKTNPSTKQGFGESQNTEGTSPIFSRHAHTRKELPVRRSDVSVLVGNMARDDTFKITRDSSPKAPKISHPGHVPKDTLITSSAEGMRHSPSSKASSFKRNVAHSGSQSPVTGSQLPVIGSQSPVFGSQSPVIGSQSPVCGSQSPVFGSHSPTFGISNWLTESSRYSSNADKLHVRTCSRESSGVKSSNSQGQVSSTDSQDKFRFPSMCFEEKHLHWLEDTRGSSLHDGNEATATSDPTGSSITIFRRDFFVKSPRTDQSSQSSNARNTTVSLIADGEDRSQWSEQMHSVRGDQKSPPLVRSPSRVRRNRAAYESRGKTSQSLESRNTEYLSLNEDHRPEEMRGGTVVTFSSSSSGLNRRRGDRHEVIKNKRSRHDAKSKTSQISKHHSRGDRSHSLTLSDGQVHHPQNVEVGSRQTRQHINYDWSESIIAGSLSFTEPHSDVQVLEDHSAHQHSVKLPLKARHKSKHGATISGNQDTRQKRSNNNAASQVSSRSTGDPSPDVQVVGSRESRRSVGEPSVRRKSRGAEVSESTDSTDIDVVELVRQLDEDERMAKQLQEHFDAELARLTQEHSRIMSSHNEILAQPLIMPELPTLPGPPLPRPPPLFPPRTQMANPVMPGIAGHQEMMWRDDLVDMNPINAAMMAEMGRFLDNNTEGQAGYGHRGRQRRGRARGRGRSRTRGHHHNPVQSDGNDYEQLWNLVERVGEAVSKGLPESSINLLPTFLYTTAGQDATENECSICMGDYEAGENMRRLPCFHFYHAACIDKWLKDNRICPVCREEVNFEAANFT
ncbi:probable GPI-anchored adhesin-like protein PGA55 [Patiria miniata]|uniref:RING-type domain-containing protein n=1 Tax=Patiria miniata TaxID=46514 RepID=A0A913ZV60_PATMI|nr:probable GPI-anchored adhesin-like protein PGA55 [Patiria miniata]